MRHFNLMQTVVVAMGFYGAAALAADSDLQVQVLNQKVAVQTSAGNPAVVAVQASGPVNLNVNLQGQSSDCLALLSQLAPQVCVPIGPGGSVSPN